MVHKFAHLIDFFGDMCWCMEEKPVFTRSGLCLPLDLFCPHHHLYGFDVLLRQAAVSFRVYRIFYRCCRQAQLEDSNDKLESLHSFDRHYPTIWIKANSRCSFLKGKKRLSGKSGSLVRKRSVFQTLFSTNFQPSQAIGI